MVKIIKKHKGINGNVVRCMNHKKCKHVLFEKNRVRYEWKRRQSKSSKLEQIKLTKF